MSVYNLKTVTDGLIFYFDTFNKKSYTGEPTNNCFFTPTPDGNGNVSFSVQGNGTFSRVFSGIYGGYEIQPSDVVYRYDLGSNGCHYHGNDYNIPAGNYVNFSFDYYVNAGGYAVTNFLANVENGGNMAGTSFTDPDTSVQRVWKRHSAYLGPSSGSGFTRFLLYPGGCSSSRLADNGYILFKNPQAEYNKQHATAFIAGGASTVTTRSSTQGLLDLTGNNVLDLTNTAFDSNGAITFNTASYIIGPENSIFNNQTFTMECWCNPTTTSQNGFLFEKGQVNTQYSNFFNSDNTFYFRTMSLSNQDLTFTTSTYVTANKWNHIVCAYNGSTKSIYVNGKLVTSTSCTGTSPTNTNGISIGIYGGYNGTRGYAFSGQIATSIVYNRGLTGSEVLQNFNATKGRFGL